MHHGWGCLGSSIWSWIHKLRDLPKEKWRTLYHGVGPTPWTTWSQLWTVGCKSRKQIQQMYFCGSASFATTNIVSCKRPERRFFPERRVEGRFLKGMSQTCMSNTCMSWLTSWVSTFGIVCDVVVEHFYVLVNILTATSGHCVWCCCRCTPCIRCLSHLHVSHLHALFNNQSLLHVTLHVSLTCVTYMSAYTCLPDMSFFVHVLTMSTHTSPSCMSLLHVSLNLCLLHVLVHVSPTCLSYKSPWHVSLTCLSRMSLLYVSLMHVSLKHFK